MWNADCGLRNSREEIRNAECETAFLSSRALSRASPHKSYRSYKSYTTYRDCAIVSTSAATRSRLKPIRRGRTQAFALPPSVNACRKIVGRKPRCAHRRAMPFTANRAGFEPRARSSRPDGLCLGLLAIRQALAAQRRVEHFHKMPHGLFMPGASER
jgi:hypothetical protein